MLDETRCDYEGMDTLAARWEAVAETLQEKMTRIRNSLQELEGGGWVGDAATKHFGDMNDQLVPSLERAHQALSGASVATTEIRSVLEEAEQMASSFLSGRA